MSSITQALNQANNEFNSALSKQKGSNMDKDSFMLLLVTRFKYQDPLNPMEDKEFIAQLAQFSSLEQLMNLNTSMEGLTDATNNQQMINATSYIGKNVSVSGNAIGKNTDEKTKEVTISKFRYAPNDNVVAGSQIIVRDADNNPVYVAELNENKAAGTTYEFEWDGKRNDGSVAPDGVYTVSLALLNSNGESVLADQVVDARVTGVVNNNGSVCLGLDGGQLILLANVRQVTEPEAKSSGGDENPPDGEDPDKEDPDGEKPGTGGTPDTEETPGTEENSGTGETTAQAA